MTPDRTIDAAAARSLTAAALVALGIGLAVSGLPWSVDVYPGLTVSGFRPPAGSASAFLISVVAAVVLFAVRELLSRQRWRAAMWTATAAATLAALATWRAVAVGRGSGLLGAAHLIGPATLLVPVALGACATLALLTASSLYEARCRDPLPADAVAYAQTRLDAITRPPEQPYYVYY